MKAQEYIHSYFPPNERKNLKELNIGNRDLTGNLDLRDFVNLETILIYGNEITADLSIFSHLTKRS